MSDSRDDVVITDMEPYQPESSTTIDLRKINEETATDMGASLKGALSPILRTKRKKRPSEIARDPEIPRSPGRPAKTKSGKLRRLDETCE